MKLKLSVVVKKDNKWFAGFLDNKKFTPNKEVKKLEDVKEVSDYITLKKFLTLKGKNTNIANTILKESGLQSIYILDKPIEPSEEEFENYWWNTLNPTCEICNKNCKQSNFTSIIKCPSFASDTRLCNICSKKCKAPEKSLITMCSSFKKELNGK